MSFIVFHFGGICFHFHNKCTVCWSTLKQARKPTVKWRLYVFKNGEAQDSALYIHKQSAYMIGRDRKVADIPSDHPSCSKQHAVLQYRHTEKEGPDGMMHKATRPYLLDLGSTNGTFINGERIDPQRYV